MFIDKRKPRWEYGLAALKPLNLQHVVIGDGETFQYLYGPANDDPAFSMWLLIFFKGTGEQIILAHTPRRTRIFQNPVIGLSQRPELAPGRSGARRPLRDPRRLEFIRDQLDPQPARLLRLMLDGSAPTVALIGLFPVL